MGVCDNSRDVPTVISTADVAPHERFELWSEETSRLFAALRTSPTSPREFWATARGQEIGSVRVARLTAVGHSVRRTRAQIAGDDPEVFWLLQALHGSTVVSQQDRTAVLRPGDLTIYDSSHPYSIVTPGPFEVAVFQIPRGLLRMPDAVVRTLTATRICADQGPAAFAVPYLRALVDGVAAGTLPEHRDDLGNGVVDLANAICAPKLAPTLPETGAGSRATLEAAKRVIEQRLDDPELSPDDVARAVFVSRRALYALFEGEGIGVAEWIRHRRLERCRRALRDPALAPWSVARIAAEIGRAHV